MAQRRRENERSLSRKEKRTNGTSSTKSTGGEVTSSIAIIVRFRSPPEMPRREASPWQRNEGCQILDAVDSFWERTDHGVGDVGQAEVAQELLDLRNR